MTVPTVLATSSPPLAEILSLISRAELVRSVSMTRVILRYSDDPVHVKFATLAVFNAVV